VRPVNSSFGSGEDSVSNEERNSPPNNPPNTLPIKDLLFVITFNHAVSLKKNQEFDRSDIIRGFLDLRRGCWVFGLGGDNCAFPFGMRKLIYVQDQSNSESS
jgi:hypothetical protein